MTAPLSPKDWLEALELGFAELARSCFSVERVTTVRRHAEPARELSGAYVGLVAPESSIQIGLAAPMESCRELARALLLMPADGEVSDADVADAVSEIVNMLGGCVQRRVRERVEVRLGLPTFFHGPVQPTERLGVTVSDVRAGASACALIVVHPRRS